MHVLRLVLIGIAIGVAIILGARMAGVSVGNFPGMARREPPPAAPSAPLTAEQARALVEARLRSASEYQRFFRSLSEQFPADYERIVESFAERTMASQAAQPPDIYIAEALRSLRQSHGVLAAKSTPGIMERVFEQQSKIISELGRANPALCADFLHGNAPPAFFTFSAANRALIAAMAEAGLEAILDGRSHGIERQAPTDEDFAALEAELEKKGLGKPEIETLLDGKAADPPIADVTMCRAGVAYYETLRSLPQDIRMRIYALTIRLLART